MEAGLIVITPPPRRGGTFLICPWIVSEDFPGGVRVTWCAQGRRGTRFRTMKAYRRHWRRYHADEAAWLASASRQPGRLAGPRHGSIVAISRWQAPDTGSAGPLEVMGWYDGPPVPDPVTFVIGEDWLDKPNLYPRQATLLKVIFLRDDLFTGYDRMVIAEWQQRFRETNPDSADNKFDARTKGLQPDLYERIRYLKRRGYKWFPELIIAIGRRGSKGYLSALCMAYVLWHYLSKGNPQEHYGIDANKPLAIAVFAGKKQQAIENLWGDLYGVLTTAPCYTQYISEAQVESLTIYAPYDFVRMRKLAARGIDSSKDMASFRILPRESTPLAPRGPAGCILAFDEAAHVKNAGVTREFGVVYGAAKPSLDQFGTDGFVVLPSSTWEMIGKFYELWELSLQREEAEDGETVPAYPDKFMVQLESWAIYQDWEIAQDLPLFPEGFAGDLGEYEAGALPALAPLKGAIQAYDETMAREEKANPDTFAVERRSDWATAMDAYLNAAMVDRMFAPWEERDENWGRPELVMQARGPLSVTYTAHGDPSSVNCRFGFALAHEEPGPDGLNHAVFDLIHFWDPADFPGHMIDYDEVGEWIYQNAVLRFMPDELTFDQWNSAASVQAMQKKIRGSRLPKNVVCYERTATAALNWSTWETFKACLNHGLVHAPLHAEARDELKFVQKPEGLQKVIPATTGPVQTKDIADTIVICAARLLGEQMKAFLAKDLKARRPFMAQPGGRDALDRFSPEGSNPYSASLGAPLAGIGGLARGMRPGTGQGRPGAMPGRAGRLPAAMRRHRS